MQDPIHRRYQELADIVRTGRVLKTDVWQETRDNDEAPIEADDYIEILPDLVEKAKGLGLNVKQGSIADIPYEDKTFDTVIDTSTIDHTPDYQTVLSEYRRVLKDDGIMLLIAWNTMFETAQIGGDLAGGQQYFFNKDEFRAEVEKHFKIVDEELLREARPKLLISYICKPL
jgi:SAM-dependent methyltransferase